MFPSRASARSLALLLCVVACDRPGTPPVRDSAVRSAAAEDVAAPPAESWSPELGSVFVVPFDSLGGIVLFPETPSAQLVASASLRLLDPGGVVADAAAHLVTSDSAVCGVAPLVRFRDSVATSWSAGLLSASSVPLRMDSVESMSPRDSARVVSELARLASTLPMDPASRFKGLPFTVLSARRFDVAAAGVLVGHLVRRLPHEAAPVEEHTLVVAERATTGAGPQAGYVTGFHLRSEGAEDVADQYEPLAALSGATRTWLILARYNDSRTIYHVLERAPDGRWRVGWSRALSC